MPTVGDVSSDAVEVVTILSGTARAGVMEKCEAPHYPRRRVETLPD
jgi:hypothetical protein